MRIYVDVTEPGLLVNALTVRARARGIEVVRTILHEREGPPSPTTRERHPFLARGGDYVVVDGTGFPLATVERKTLHDFAKSSQDFEGPTGSAKIFRQLNDLAANPFPILILEGRPSPAYRSREGPLLGLQFWCLREGIGLLHTSSPLATAHAVFLVARKLQEEAGTGAPQPLVQSGAGPDDADERDAWAGGASGARRESPGPPAQADDPTAGSGPVRPGEP